MTTRTEAGSGQSTAPLASPSLATAAADWSVNRRALRRVGGALTSFACLLCLVGCFLQPAKGIKKFELESPGNGATVEGEIPIAFKLKINANPSAAVCVIEDIAHNNTRVCMEADGDDTLRWYPRGPSRQIDATVTAQVSVSSGAAGTSTETLSINWIAPLNLTYTLESSAGTNTWPDHEHIDRFGENFEAPDRPIFATTTLTVEQASDDSDLIESVSFTLNEEEPVVVTSPPYSISWPPHAERAGNSFLTIETVGRDSGVHMEHLILPHDHCRLPLERIGVDTVSVGEASFLDMQWDDDNSVFVLWRDDNGTHIAAAGPNMSPGIHPRWADDDDAEFVELVRATGAGVAVVAQRADDALLIELTDDRGTATQVRSSSLQPEVFRARRVQDSTDVMYLAPDPGDSTLAELWRWNAADGSSDLVAGDIGATASLIHASSGSVSLVTGVPNQDTTWFHGSTLLIDPETGVEADFVGYRRSGDQLFRNDDITQMPDGLWSEALDRFVVSSSDTLRSTLSSWDTTFNNPFTPRQDVPPEVTRISQSGGPVGCEEIIYAVASEAMTAVEF